jgi:hypothetical protein
MTFEELARRQSPAQRSLILALSSKPTAIADLEGDFGPNHTSNRDHRLIDYEGGYTRRYYLTNLGVLVQSAIRGIDAGGEGE